MLRTADRRVRPGFTLVELLVAAAVCVLIMAVLAGAFSLGIDTVRQMKGTGDMMDQLRGAGTMLRDDLKVNHFLNENGQPQKLSEFRMDQIYVKDQGSGASPQYVLDRGSWKPPAHGFFRVRSTDISGTTNKDADFLTNGTGVATDHYLHFTSILEAATDDDYFRATALDSSKNGRPYHSIAAEVAYLLEGPVGTTPGGSNLFRLIRRQRLAAVSDTDRRDRPWPGDDPLNQAVISLRPSGQPSPRFFLNTLADLTDPRNRLGQNINTLPSSTPSDPGLAPMSSRTGEDTVLSNVLSFEVQVAYAGSGSPGESPATRSGVPPMTVGSGPGMVIYPRDFNPSGNKNDVTEYPFDTLPPSSCSKNDTVAGNTYDSWSAAFKAWETDIDQKTGQLNASSNVPPLLIRVQAVQIRIRVWDHKTQSARQITFVQDL